MATSGSFSFVQVRYNQFLLEKGGDSASTKSKAYHYLPLPEREWCHIVNLVGIVDAKFAAGVDTILSLPHFHKPGSVVVIEVDGFIIENHAKVWR